MARVALAQFRVHRDKETNVRTTEAMARRAAEGGANIVCFSELCTAMYFCFERDRGHFDYAETIPGPSVDRMRTVAGETGTVIVYPIFERDGARFFNTAAVIGADGAVLGKYRKMSIPRLALTPDRGDTESDEQFYFSRGDLGFPVFPTPFGVNVGILICYDRHFPEAARILALNGAHVILVPTATSRLAARDAWEAELRGHAIANNLYVGGVNRVGVDIGGFAGRPHFGSSVAFNPRGEPIVRAEPDRDQIVHFDVDRALVEKIRDVWGFFRERRPDAYEPILRSEIVVPASPAGTARRG
ncbi:MAG TPA: nitrilase-related carbon-nitrogen hydrolase [bacterium]|nr:nitrilase-related carbon-nitrogen hydrolase [bacterium]